MSDETNTGANGSATPAGPNFTVEKIYVKDVSFEVPGAPGIYLENVTPELSLNLNQRVQRLSENTFEVVLNVTLTCKAGEKTVYVAEVQQAGIFGLNGFEPQAIDALLGTQCPNILFPYVRQLLSDLIQAGGFPAFLLQPVNFDGLYADTLRQRAQQAQQQQGAIENDPPVGNA